MNGTLLGQTKGNDTIVFLYDEKANRYGFDYNGTKYYYIFNVQGDVIGILNQSGTQIVSYQYDPWGKVLSVSGSEAATIEMCIRDSDTAKTASTLVSAGGASWIASRPYLGTGSYTHLDVYKSQT